MSEIEVVVYQSKVRPVEIDGQHRVHHSAFLDWMEIARFEYFNRLGISIYELMEKGIDLVVSNISLTYSSPLIPDDEYYVTSWIEIKSPIRMIVHCKVYNSATNQVCCHGRFEGVPVNKENKILKKYINNELIPAIERMNAKFSDK